MTFLIDPPLLIIFSLVSCWIGDNVKGITGKPVGKILAVFSVCVILITSTSLYLNMWFMDWFWMPFSSGVTSGRDLMINSGLFSFEAENTSGVIDNLALLQIVLYPLWTYIGLKLWNLIQIKNTK